MNADSPEARLAARRDPWSTGQFIRWSCGEWDSAAGIPPDSFSVRELAACRYLVVADREAGSGGGDAHMRPRGPEAGLRCDRAHFQPTTSEHPE